MALINPLIGSNLVTGAAPFNTTLIEKSVWMDGSADGFTRAASDFDDEDGKEFTLGTWFQLTEFGVTGALFCAGTSGGYTSLRHSNDDKIYFQTEAGSAILSTPNLYRDIGWYHLLLSVDTTQVAANNRVRLFINGEEVIFSGTQPSVNHAYEFNTAEIHEVGDSYENGAFEGYLAQSFMIGSKSIQQGDFAITDFLDTYTFGTNGSQFIPKAHSEIKTLVDAGSDNSFLLDYDPADPTASNALGLDTSTYGNNFTSTSMGSANQSPNTPSKVYSIFNPLAHADNSYPGTFTLSEGNTKNVLNSSNTSVKTTVPFVMSGSNIIRAQFTFSTIGDGGCGITGSSHTSGTYHTSATSVAGRGDVGLCGSGALVIDGQFNNSYTSALSNGDVVDVIVNCDVGAVYFAVDGTLLGGATQSEIQAGTTTNAALVSSFVRRTAGEVFNFYAFQYNPTSTTVEYNSGQSSFTHSYSTITSLKSLNTADLPAPDYQGIDYFDATIYEGNGTGQRVGDFVPYTDAYTVDNSAMFEHDDARYLSRTIEAPSAAPSVAKKGTWSIWFKTANIDTDCVFFDTGTTATNRFSLQMDASGQIIFSHGGTTILKTSGDFKGDGAWHNLVLKVDTALSSASARAIMFIDGVEQTAFETDARSSLSQHAEIGYMDENATQFVGSYNGSSANQWDGYLAEAVFLDNQFENASSFGQVDTSTNRWVPKSVSGLTFGNCGFYLEFETAPNLGTLIAQGTGTAIGNMTAGGGLAAAFDGDIENYNAGAQANATSGNLGKDWGSGVTKTITGVVVKMLGNASIDGGVGTETMTLTVQRSDNGTDFTTVYTESGISVPSAATITRRDGFTNTAAARYARVSVNHSGGAETHISELEFYEGGTAGIGTDSSSNGNNFTQGGSWVAADQSTDTPSENFAVMNPGDQDSSTATTLSKGNLKVSMGTTAGDGIRGTLPYNGKIYWEVELDAISSNSGSHIGIATKNHNLALTADDTSGNGQKDAFVGVSSFSSNLTGFISGSNFDSSYGGLGNNFGTAGKYLMFAVDTDAGKFWAGYDGTWFGSGNPAAGTNDSGKDISLYDTWFPAISRIGSAGSGAFIFNFGQTSFAHTPPTGFSKLNQDNLDDTASKLTAWAWIKNRDATDSHVLIDRVRGVGVEVHTDGTTTTPETTNTNTVQRFLQRGVQIGSDVQVNTLNESYVLWQWLIGDSATTGTTNESGSLDSTVIAADAGHFSVVSWTGNETLGATIGHGLGGTPEFIIAIARAESGENKPVYHKFMTSDNDHLKINESNAQGTAGTTIWDVSAMSSTLIGLGAAVQSNSNNGMIAYCFRSVSGVCKVGKYTGNGDGSTGAGYDGPYINLGFKPKFILVKRTDVANSWILQDTSRHLFNPVDNYLQAESNSSETATSGDVDFLSDGIKIRTGNGNAWNASGGTYLYLAMADIGGNGTLPPIYGR
jgi:hypothetical protein